ncbi:MAG: putative secreted protein [uncultured Thermomicrobiales bacterium]|uniref:Putative secreted protein n=1 Tax=uncultured Thermomicrobiales bacterium TaxID=1645740 RepID=A0A6J4VIS3_9BACT|nr:MAG: putative secreted protein [uncultured Thermomicrobiales bacterium]
METTSTRPALVKERSKEEDRPRPSSRALPLALVLAVGVALLAGAAAALAWTQAAGSPADDSADAGFARDMAFHHSQAVEMAWIAFDRSQDPAIRTLATDIVLTQQAQIGMMRGWLDAWGLAPTGWEPRMAWMGHPMDGPMPGMASPEEVASLRELPPSVADGRFLELMIRHHEGGLEMARAGIELGEQPVVRRLAESILTSQRYEIEAMEAMLAGEASRSTP